MLKGHSILGIIALLSLCLSSPSLADSKNQLASPSPLPMDKNVKAFISNMVKKYHFERKTLEDIFAKTFYLPEVIRHITYPYEKKPWDFYRNYFINQARVIGGVDYWKIHAKTLADVQRKYGVDPSVIVAIIGIESRYGTRRGQFQEIGALSTLAFKYPKREAFFKKELKEYLLMTRKMNLPVLEMQGSYAGALGIPQFMPSSYRHYAIDYSKSKKIDLINDHSDAIASVANYLQKEGWKRNQPIAFQAILNKKLPEKFISHSGQPRYTLATLKKHGITVNANVSPHTKAALVQMSNTDSSEYWVTFGNFRAIMNYNPRTTYALAVYQLSRKIKEAYEQSKTNPSTKTTS